MSSRHEHGGWVGFVLVGARKIGVSGGWAEASDIATVVGSAEDAGASDETSSEVLDDVTVEVWHHHNVELPWVAHQLHASVIDDHVLVLYLAFVLLGDLVTGSHE